MGASLLAVTKSIYYVQETYTSRTPLALKLQL